MIVRRASISGKLSTRIPLKGKWRLFTVRIGDGWLKRCADEYLTDMIEVPQGELLVRDEESGE